MKSKAFWFVVVLIVIALGVYWWYISAANKAANVENNPAITQGVGSPSNSTGVKGGTNQANHGTNTVPVFREVTTASLGTYLTGPSGMTLYRYTKDILNHSNCTGECVQTWIPYTPDRYVSYAPLPGMTGKISTIVREDGLNQVTYNGEPLYYFSNDINQGDATGQGVGGVWYVVKP